jgi:hypothetical protein
MSVVPEYQKYFFGLERWYERVRSVVEGRVHGHSSDYYEDELSAFFLYCYHFKDWLKNGSDRDLFSDVESFFHESVEMCVCADYALGIKHLVVTTPKKDAQTAISRRDISLALGGDSSPKIQISWKIKSGNDIYDAFEVATICMKKWEEYMKSRLSPHELNLK